VTAKVLPITIEELQASLDAADPPTSDDVSITSDGRRLDSKDAVLAWLAEVDDQTAAERYALLDDGAAS
jgi:hypothetical protein